MSDFIIPSIEGFVLAVVGLFLCINMICTANLMPKRTPWSFAILIAGGFAAGVGMTVTAWTGDVAQALRFALGAVVMLVGQSVWLWLNGYHIWNYLGSIIGGHHHEPE